MVGRMGRIMMKIQTSKLPSIDDTFMFGRLSGLPYMRRDNVLYCFYPGAKQWHVSLNNSLATFVTEAADYFAVRERFPDSVNSPLRTD